MTATARNGTIRFKYDRLNRLIEVVTPAGKRLTYLYDEGEPDVRMQMDQGTKLNVSGRVTSLPMKRRRSA